jgi:tight adherence protein B
MGMGISLAEALDQLAERVPSRDVELFAASLSIQYRTGGALSPVLRKIAYTVRERVNMRSEVNALTAQQRYSAYVISLLPVTLLVLIKFISPNYFALIMQPGMMRFILVGSAVGIVVGLFVMLRIADVEV